MFPLVHVHREERLLKLQKPYETPWNFVGEKNWESRGNKKDFNEQSEKNEGPSGGICMLR